MISRLKWLSAVSILLLALTNQSDSAEPAKEDLEAISKSGGAFIAAFDKGDAKALAAFWATEGEYAIQSGRTFKGREAIENAFKAFFADNKDLKAQITSESLRFITPDVAVEEGLSEVFTPDGAPPSRARFTNIHVKKDGKWLLSSVKDLPFVPPNNVEHLRVLSGIIGEWTGSVGKGEEERISFAWSENQNFIVGSMSTTFGNVTIAGAKVWIGWDPTAKRVRSWMFDTAGGFGEGAWTKEGKKWLIKTTSVLSDGDKAAATFSLTVVDGDTIALRTTDRSVGGKALPDTKEVQLKRVK